MVFSREWITRHTFIYPLIKNTVLSDLKSELCKSFQRNYFDFTYSSPTVAFNFTYLHNIIIKHLSWRKVILIYNKVTSSKGFRWILERAKAERSCDELEKVGESDENGAVAYCITKASSCTGWAMRGEEMFQLYRESSWVVLEKTLENIKITAVKRTKMW